MSSAILSSCGSQYTHKNLQVETRQQTYKLDDVFFVITKARLNKSEQGEFFVTEWSVKNTGQSKRKIRLSEKPNETYLLYGQKAAKVSLYGIGIGTCEGRRQCFSYLNLLPQQTLTFVLKSRPRNLSGVGKTNQIMAKLRARFEIKEENYYTYPVDIEFNNLVFPTANWTHVYGKKK